MSESVPAGPVSSAIFHTSILIFGDSGTGKTSAAVRAAQDLDLDLDAQWDDPEQAPKGDPKMYVILLEPQGRPTVMLTNPAIQPDAIKVCTTFEQLAREMKLAASGKLVEMGYEHLVIDGVTECQRLIKDKILEGYGDDIPKLEWDDWGELKERTRRFLRLVRSIPMRVTATALEMSKAPKEAPTDVKICPQFEGSVFNEIMQYFGAVGRIRREINGQRVEHLVEFRLPSRYTVKGIGPINGRQKPCVSAYFDVLAGKLPPSATRYVLAPSVGGVELAAPAPQPNATTANATNGDPPKQRTRKPPGA